LIIAEKAKMKIEYRNLSHACGKVSTFGIGAGSLHEYRSQEIKDISFPRTMMFPQCIESSGSFDLILDGLAVRGTDVKSAD
jgi:hypothetical protein